VQHGCCFTTVWRPLLKTSVTTLDDFFQSCGLSDPCSPASTVAAIPAVAVKDQYIALLPKVPPFFALDPCTAPSVPQRRWD
jgi:hypothetical protein